MNAKVHVGGDKANDSVRMAGGVVEQLDDGVHGCFRAVSLGGSKAAESDEHGAVDGTGVVEEDSDDLLDELLVFGTERGRSVGLGRELALGAVVGSLPGMRRVLATLGRLVAETL